MTFTQMSFNKVCVHQSYYYTVKENMSVCKSRTNLSSQSHIGNKTTVEKNIYFMNLYLLIMVSDNISSVDK